MVVVPSTYTCTIVHIPQLEQITQLNVKIQKNQYTLPCKLGFSTAQALQQDCSLSIAPKKETGVQLDCMTFSSEGTHHHIPSENQTPYTYNRMMKQWIFYANKKNG